MNITFNIWQWIPLDNTRWAFNKLLDYLALVICNDIQTKPGDSDCVLGVVQRGLTGEKWCLVLLCLNLHLPTGMDCGKHEDCHYNIQTVRGEGKGGHLLTKVMDKGMAH